MEGGDSWKLVKRCACPRQEQAGTPCLPDSTTAISYKNLETFEVKKVQEFCTRASRDAAVEVTTPTELLQYSNIVYYFRIKIALQSPPSYSLLLFVHRFSPSDRKLATIISRWP
ncbi:hypothetical protein QQP08_026319 [Theobroma cacao]|nr:hypothetical protein QQP08_025686 [Theobroma cacao]WRX33832.1 hypothetical protein QQP08_026319 [Theobroma cacao]